MIILHRRLIRGFLGPFIFCVSLFAALFVLVDALNNLDEFLSGGASWEVLSLYYMSLMPVVLSEVAPSAAVIAALYFLGNLNRHNEIAAMRAGGSSGWSILSPVLYMGLLVSCGVLMMNEVVTPRAAVYAETVREGMIRAGEDGTAGRSIANTAMITAGNRMVYAREFLPSTRSIYDVIIILQRPDMSFRGKVTAKRGVYENGRWVLYDALEYGLARNGEVSELPEHRQRVVTDIRETPEELLRQHTDPRFMSARALSEHLGRTSRTGFRASRRLEVELHRKLAHPFAAFVLLIASAPLALRNRRGGFILSLGTGLLVMAGYYVTTAFLSALGKGGLVPPSMAAWLPNSLFLLGGLVLVRRNL